MYKYFLKIGVKREYLPLCMEKINNTRTVIITGPESTGKTVIAEHLAQEFNCDWIPEFARTYVENLNNPYTYADVEHIAIEQIKSFKICNNNPLVIFDTGLIITKVWFDVVYKRHPKWLPYAIEANNPDLYLLCNTDLPWIPDSVRENGGEMRQTLFDLYEKELNNFGINYKVVTGKNQERLYNASSFVKDILI